MTTTDNTFTCPRCGGSGYYTVHPLWGLSCWGCQSHGCDLGPEEVMAAIEGREVYYTVAVYCDRQGEIVDGELKAWDSEDDAYTYLSAAREEEPDFADGAVVDHLPCATCYWLYQWSESSSFSGCGNEQAPSPYREASRWGGLPGCPQWVSEHATMIAVKKRQMQPKEVAVEVRS